MAYTLRAPFIGIYWEIEYKLNTDIKYNVLLDCSEFIENIYCFCLLILISLNRFHLF